MFPHQAAAAIGVVGAVVLQRWIGRSVLAYANLAIVPVVAWFSPSGADAIGRVDKTYLPTFVVLVTCVLALLVARHLYGRQPWRLVLPKLLHQAPRP